jgi:hypothetical protein
MSTSLLYLADHFTYEQRISPPPTAYGRTASGYGNRIATDWLVRISGSTGTQPALYGGDCRWRRVYATCWSNAASLWVNVPGHRFYFRDCDLSHTA